MLQMLLIPQNEDLPKIGMFCFDLFVGVTDAAKGKNLPFGSNRSGEPLLSLCSC
jgi:hypothetical protein